MTHPNRPPALIAQAGLLAGTLDILAAMLSYVIQTGKNPVAVLKFVASGVFGTEAFSGGTGMAVWGLVFHYAIAFGFAALFGWVYPKWAFLRKSPVVAGLGYGVFVWLVMNLLVVPLSQAPKMPFRLGGALLSVVILMGCVGLPISLVTSRFYARRRLTR